MCVFVAYRQYTLIYEVRLRSTYITTLNLTEAYVMRFTSLVR